MEKLQCAQAKQIDLVDYLASIGHLPKKISNNDYWYLSPLHEEKTPSFKVNRPKNIWYDHGTGHGGTLVDFGIRYHQCGISELLNLLSLYQINKGFSFHPPTLPHPSPAASPQFAGEKEKAADSKIVILDTRPLTEKSLIHYLYKRCIPEKIAAGYCREVDFLLYGKQRTVIGFPNNAGGFELRSDHFKGSSAPKDITFLDNSSQQLAVFEGFFNFLAFQSMGQNADPLSNFLILNSLAFLEKSRPLMEDSQQIHLYLDRDTAGINHTSQVLEWGKKYIDRSSLYKDHKDLNDWLIHHHNSLKQSQWIGRRF